MQPSSLPTKQPSMKPSSQPLTQPSVQPTMQPSKQPTMHPSSQPSLQPTTQPTSQPSRQPSSQPISHPSRQPSLQPSLQPTLQPSRNPSSQPSSQPATQAPSQPSSQPTIQPSRQPSSQPTKQPATDSPSQPSSQPTSQPSRQPLSQPTSQPSRQPTTQPSSQPSSQPSLQPTSRPTSQPSSLPFSPSFMPSATPTMSYGTILKSHLQVDLAGISARILYQDMYVNGESLLGGCNQWLAGTGSSSLSVLTLTQQILNVSLLTFDATKNVSTISTCNDPTTALSIVTAIKANTVMTSISCVAFGVSHNWMSKKCSSGVVAVCVDCIDPCGTSQCTNLESVNPCGASVGNGYGCSSRNSSVNAYRVFSATLQPIFVAPTFRSVVATAVTKTSASVTVRLQTVSGGSVDGIVYCASFPSGAAPMSAADIVLQNHAATTMSSIATVIVNGLIPATTYSVYCLAQGILGTSMTLADAVKFKISIVTVCCKSVSISVLIQSLYQGESSVNAIQVTLDSPPSTSFTLSLATSAPFSAVTTALVPARTYFTNAIKITTAMYSIPSTSSAILGVTSLVASLNGVSASEYQVVFVNRNNFTVLSIDVPPPVPELVSVRFSNDGTLLNVAFDSDTDKGGISASSFVCALLFGFPGVNNTEASATCTWTSASLVTINLGSSATIVVGDTFTLIDSFYKIRAICLSTVVKCARYSTIKDSTVNVLSPPAASRPIVGIFAPSIIGKCDSFTLDLSSSTGGSGRPFTSIMFAVSSNGNSIAAQIFLNSKYIISPPMAVPYGTFPEGLNNIVVTICNFLGMCGQGTQQLIVTSNNAPVVTIAGGAMQSMTTSRRLVLNADAYVSSCSSAGSSRAGLTYAWVAYKNGVQDFTIVSVSKQFNAYKLKANTLAVNSVYSFTLTVLDTVTLKSSVNTVAVNIIPSGLVAVITGDTRRSVLLGTSVTIDASTSYDQDLFGVVGAAAGLSFIWSCGQIAPTISSTCGLMLGPSTSAPTLNMTANSASAGTTSTLSVTVFDSTRSSTTTIIVRVQAADKPLVRITSAQIFTVVNPDTQIVVAGSISLSGVGTSVWSLNDTSIDIVASSLSPVTQILAAGINAVTLTMGANTLAAGSTLAFTLSSTGFNGLSSSASTIVVINAPPQPGNFIVSPLTGSELMTSYTMAASQWHDKDLPLQYAFGYLSATGALVIQLKSQLAYRSSLLPAGQDTSGFNISCQLQVYDSYLAYSSMNTSVTVKKVVIEASALLSLVTTSLSDKYSPAASAQILGVATSIVNAVSCISGYLAGSPLVKCAQLNRKPCSSTANTCGSCLEGYLGDTGDHNSRCIALVSATIRRSLFLLAAGRVCSHTADCTFFDECVDNVCSTPSKSCSNNCNGNGVCSFVSIDTGHKVDDCKLGNTQCSAVCSCRLEYKGRECDTTTLIFLANQKLRFILIDGLNNLTRSQDADLSSVVGWASTAVSLSHNYGELTNDSLSLITQIISTVIKESSALALPYNQVSTVLSAVNSLAASTTPFVEISSLIQAYSKYVLSQMSPQQYDVVSNFDEFKIISAIKTVIKSSISLSTPLTASEVLAGTQSNAILLNISKGVSNVKVGVVLTRLRTFNNQLVAMVHSNPIMVVLPDLSVCASIGCGFTLVAQTVDNVTYFDGSGMNQPFVTHCRLNVVSMTNHTCSNGLNVTVLCDGKAVQTIASKCPYVITKPSCGRLSVSSSSVTNDICTLSSYTSTETACVCTVPIATFSSTSRRLQEGETRRELATSGMLQIGTIAVKSVIITPQIVVQPPTLPPTPLPILSLSPTGSPPAVPVLMNTFQVVQNLGNVNVTTAETSRFRTGFIATVASTLDTSNSAVMLVSIVALQSTRRALLASGVQMNYNVQSPSTGDQIGTVLNNAISSGLFGNELRRNTGFTVTASANAIVTDVTPTNMPSLMPSASTEFVTGLRLGTTPMIIIAVVGFLLILSIFLLIYMYYFGRKNRYLTRNNRVLVEVLA